MEVIVKCFMRVWLFLFFASSSLWSFDLIQITNTPDVNEGNHSIAVKNKSIYLTWEAANTIYFAKSKDGGSNWSTPIEIGKGIQPSIAVGENSLVYIVWARSYNDTVFSIYSENDGGNFPEYGKRRIGYGHCPVVSIDNKNGIHVVWFLLHKNPFYVRALHPDSAFSSPVAVDTAYYKWAESMDIVTDDEAQNIYVTWTGPSPHYILVNMSVSCDAGTSFEKILVGDLHGDYYPSLAFFSNDDIYLVWEHDAYGQYNVLFRKFEDWGQNPGPVIRLNERSAGWRASRSPIFYPSIAVDHYNKIYVAWTNAICGSGDSTDIYFDKSIDGGQSFGTDIRIKISQNPSSKRNPSIIIIDPDTIGIVWEDNRDGDYDIYFTHIPINTNFPPYLISPCAVNAFEDSLFEYTARAIDPENSIITYTFENYPKWLTPSDSTISGIPREGTKDTCFVVIASDGELADTLLVAVTFVPSWAQAPFNKITCNVIAHDGGISWSSNWVDYNNDGYLDLFIANGGVSNSENNFFYQNNRGLSFLKITTDVIVNDGGYSTSSSWGDYDNDGYLDLFVGNTNNENNFLYHNKGDDTFEKITDSIIVNDGGHSMSCSWCDYDNDGLLDLFVANGNGEVNFLYHNDGGGKFSKITEGEIVNNPSNSWGCGWADFDNDGDLDLFVANSFENNVLYQNNGGGLFGKIITGDIVNDGGDSWGISWGDYDNDGHLDLFVANFGNNFLYHNKGDGTFEKITSGEIVNDGGHSTGSAWGDYDNDGDLDLFVTNDYNENNFLYQNKGDGTFRKVTHGIIVEDGGRSGGSSFGDFDNDGYLDLAVVALDNFLYQNKGNSNNWINIKCIGTISNFSAIGAKVKVKANINGVDIWQMNEISGQTGGGGSSQNSLNVEFGLGNAAIIDSILLIWPSGIRQVLTNITPNQIITIQEDTKGYDISGNISYYSNSLPVNDAVVSLTGSLNLEDATDTNGNYQFLQIPSGDYTSMPKKEEHKPKDFITPYDAALLLQYAVGLINFTPYQMIASDVSGNGEITAFDASLILRYFVGLIDSFSVMPDKSHFWTFVPTGFHIDTLNWSIAPDSLRYEPLNSDTLNQDFVGIIYGDVSGNWTGSTDLGAAVITEINIGNIQHNNDDKWFIPLEMVFSDEAYSGSFKVLFSNPDLKFASCSIDNSLPDNMLFTSNSFPGGINFAFASAQPLNEQPIKINILFEEIKPVTPSVSNFEFVDVVVDDKSATVTVVESQSNKQVPLDWHLSQNYPNPFNAETSISYQVPKLSRVKIEVFNLLGQRLRTLVNEKKNPGTYKAIWNGKDNQGRSVGSGIYIYRMDAGKFTAIKKMVLVQ